MLCYAFYNNHNTEVLFFLGFANFYHKIIKEYLKVALSLTDLTKKNTKWV